MNAIRVTGRMGTGGRGAGFLIGAIAAIVLAGSVAWPGLALADDDDFLAMVEEQEELAAEDQVADPIEGWNRLMFQFNDTLWIYALRPITMGYEAVVPESGRLMIKDFFHNITTPVRLVSSLLQADLEKSGREAARFGINTVMGGLGLFDVADLHFDMKKTNEDVGQALGSYGIGHGFYIVWPLFGPSSPRDTVGRVGDWFLNPLTYVPEEQWPNIGVKSLQGINTFSFRREEMDELREAAIDPYIALRDFYIQKRAQEVRE